MPRELPDGLALTCMSLKLSPVQQDIDMSITFRLETDGHFEPINLTNSNAAALLALAGLPTTPYGEIPHEHLDVVIPRLLRVANSESCRGKALTTAIEAPRWSEGARTDNYLYGRTCDLLDMLASARRHGCCVIWG